MLSARRQERVAGICFTSRMATVSQPKREHAAPWQTHTVFNQAPALENVDVYSSNLPLVEAVEREGAGWIGERAAELGRFVGGAPQQSWGRLANENGPRLLAPGEKASAIAGMAMTEKQGGSDVRANTTIATALDGGGPGGEYEITGHKWFCSAPMSDIFLVLAQTEEGLSCFLLPRILP